MTWKIQVLSPLYFKMVSSKESKKYFKIHMIRPFVVTTCNIYIAFTIGSTKKYTKKCVSHIFWECEWNHICTPASASTAADCRFLITDDVHGVYLFIGLWKHVFSSYCWNHAGWCTNKYPYAYYHWCRVMCAAYKLVAERIRQKNFHFAYNTAICWLNALRCFLINNDASNKFFNCTTALANWRVALLF